MRLFAQLGRTILFRRGTTARPKQSIIAFVEKVTKEGGPDFVKPELRIATFDNDGTLWCEQPMYFQVLFAFARIKETANQHPEWKDKEPYKFVLDGDMKALAAHGEKSSARNHLGHTYRHDSRRISHDRSRLDAYGPPSAIQSAV